MAGTDAHLVIDSRPAGLPHAPGYYATFAQEPSPLGLLKLDAKRTTALGANASLATLLDALAGLGTDAAVVVVCHAYSQGLLLPVAPLGQNVSADGQTLAALETIVDAEVEAKRIRKLPDATAADKAARVAAWTALINKVQPGALQGTASEAELAAFYAKWLNHQAQRMEFGNNGAARLSALVDQVVKVRGLKIARLEFRACNLGNAAAMEVVRKFFGAAKLTAPTVGTFYISPIPVDVLARLDTGRTGHDPPQHATAQRPGGLGWPSAADIAGSRLHLADTGHTTRGFLEAALPLFVGFRGICLSTPVRYHRFELTVDEVRAFHYTARGAVVSTGDGRTPDWKAVAEFVRGHFQSDSTYAQGPFPIAGLWTPGGSVPFVLPLEATYVSLLSEAPPPPKAKP